jgi:hypothetical protein
MRVRVLVRPLVPSFASAESEIAMKLTVTRRKTLFSWPTWDSTSTVLPPTQSEVVVRDLTAPRCPRLAAARSPLHDPVHQDRKVVLKAALRAVFRAADSLGHLGHPGKVALADLVRAVQAVLVALAALAAPARAQAQAQEQLGGAAVQGLLLRPPRLRFHFRPHPGTRGLPAVLAPHPRRPFRPFRPFRPSRQSQRHRRRPQPCQHPPKRPLKLPHHQCPTERRWRPLRTLSAV